MVIKIWQKGFGLMDFAKAYGCTIHMVCQVASGKLRSAKLEKLIAETLGEPVESLFPNHGRYRGGRGKVRAA